MNDSKIAQDAGRHVDLNMAKIQVEVKDFRCGKKLKIKKNVRVVGYPVSWAPCCE